MTKSLFGGGLRLSLGFALFARLLIQLRHLLPPTFAWNVQKSRTASYLPFALLFASAAKICFRRAIPVAWFRLESPSCKCLALSRSFVYFDFFWLLVCLFVTVSFCSVLFACPIPQQKIAIRLLVSKKIVNRRQIDELYGRWLNLSFRKNDSIFLWVSEKFHYTFSIKLFTKFENVPFVLFYL